MVSCVNFLLTSYICVSSGPLFAMAFYLAWLGLAMAVAAEGSNKSRIWFSTALGDNMVLQHDSPRLWGWADSSAGLTSVTVNVKGADCSAAFGQSEGQAAPGKWVRIPL